MRPMLASILPRETFSSRTKDIPDFLVIEYLPSVDNDRVTADILRQRTRRQKDEE